MELLSYLINFLAVIFWGFRAYALLKHSQGAEFPIKPLNPTIEIIMLFITLLMLYMIFKRKLAAGIIYFGMYFAYFGTAILKFFETGGSKENAFINFLGIVISLLTFLDLLFNNARVGKKGDKKTEWFYGDDKYELDDDPRRDKNRYRIM